MYDHIEGTPYHITGNRMVLRSGGIGYEMLIPFSSLDGFTRLHSTKIYAWTHLIVKEDIHTLYGFFTVQERDCFRLLIQVSGVGPTTALTILSAMSVSEVLAAIGREDVPAFKAIKGIGQKTAEQIILDLYKKVGPVEPTPPQGSTDHPYFFDAVDALMSLGYSKIAATKAVKAACGEADGLQDIVKLAIKYAQ